MIHFSVSHRAHKCNCNVCIIAPLSFHAENSIRNEICFRFEGILVLALSPAKLKKVHLESRSAGESIGRCTVLRCCPGNWTRFAKHHQFASWNSLALHNLDPKWWLIGLFLQRKGKECWELNKLCLRGKFNPFLELAFQKGIVLIRIQTV